MIHSLGVDLRWNMLADQGACFLSSCLGLFSFVRLPVLTYMHMHTFNQVSSICALNLHSPIVSLKQKESISILYSSKEFRPAHTLSGWAHDLTEPSSLFELGCSNPPLWVSLPWQKKEMSQCCGYCQSVTLVVLLSTNTARTLAQYTPGVKPKPRSAGIDKKFEFVTENKKSVFFSPRKSEK